MSTKKANIVIDTSGANDVEISCEKPIKKKVDDGIKAPVFEKNEKKYLQDVDEYNMKLSQNKYNLVLKFINEWLGLDEKKITSFVDFKNFSEDDLLIDLSHNETIVKKYVEIFEREFSINLKVEKDDDTENDTDKYILYVFNRVVTALKYRLIKTMSGKNTYYTIKSRN